MTDDFEAALRAAGWREHYQAVGGGTWWAHPTDVRSPMLIRGSERAVTVAFYVGREQGRREQQASICQGSNLDCTPPEGEEDRYAALEAVLYGRPEPCHCGFYNRERRHAPLGGGGDCPYWKEYRNED